MRYFTYIVLIIINFILQTTVFNYIEIIGVKPNTMLILIVSFAFMRGEIEGGLIGFVSGLLVDSLYGQVLGLNAFIGLVVGFLCGRIFNEFYKDSMDCLIWNLQVDHMSRRVVWFHNENKRNRAFIT